MKAISVDRILRDASADTWPAPMRREAFHGVAGEFVDLVEPHTEADPHAMLVQFLAAAGNAIGRGPGVMADGAFHPPVVWPAVIGQTAKARKGTSWVRVRDPLALACPDWEPRIAGGLSTGEGLVHQIRDERSQRRKAKKDESGDEDGMVEEIADAGVTDKRLCVVETELASTFAAMRRDTNTLSATLRNLWDHGQAGGLTKNDPSRVKRGHVTVIGHCTLDELLTVISDVDVQNGLLNRFLFCCARRTKELPEGGMVPAARLAELVARLATVIRGASEIDRHIEKTRAARELWKPVYSRLTADRPGRLNAILARAEPYVLRLSLIYALLDGRDVIDTKHLKAAVAVWDYCADSAAYIFGDKTGNELADRILAALRQAENGLTRTQIRDLVGGRVTDSQLHAVFELFERHGLASMTLETDTGGRPAERWQATREEEQ